MYEDIIGRQHYLQAAQMGADVGYPAPLVTRQGYALEAADPVYAEVDALNVRQVQQPQMAVRERQGLRLQRQWYGFKRTKICAKECVRIRAQAEVLMKIIRLYIPDDCNFALLVSELTIAKNNLINGDPVSASIFSPLAVTAYPQTATETIQPGCSATITLENVSDTDVYVSVSCDVGLAW